MVIAAVSEQRVGSAARTADPARSGRIASSRGSDWVTSLRFPPVSSAASRGAVPVVIRWCFKPARPRSTGGRPVASPLSTPLTPEESTTHRGQSSRHTVSNSASRTSCSRRDTHAAFQCPQPAPARHAQPKAQAGGRCSQGDPGVQHVQDPKATPRRAPPTRAAPPHCVSRCKCPAPLRDKPGQTAQRPAMMVSSEIK